MSEATGAEDKGGLDRTIGLLGATTIGTGIMIGAGIFVFPGLAAGNAGPAASISFAIGAVIALLVALPASELATAMPKSGGGYYFVSRSLGTFAGTIVGIGLVFGLIFASAFYLVGLGEYIVELLVVADVITTPVTIGPLEVVTVTGLGIGVLLTVISVFGTENTESIQNVVVGVLLAILLVFLSISAIDFAGVRGRPDAPTTFAPQGYAPVLSTAALVFTSYLGFVQVATVAEEVVNPDRNLPLAMIGSVILVGTLYVATMLLTGYTLQPEELLDLGETAIVAVGEAYLGLAGALIILFGGLLATISSANASILSASRALYGLSADALVPEQAATVNKQYGTPHFALAFVGGTTVALVVVGETEVLAEVASFLHLILYALICVALLVLRRRDPDWYQPSFRTPGYPVVPIVGGAASFVLILFMEPLSQILGTVIVIIAAVWYVLYGRSITLKDNL